MGIELGKGVAHALGQIQGVGRRLADHANGHGGTAVEPDGRALVGGAFLHTRHITHLDRKAVDALDDDFTELRRAHQVRLGSDTEFALLRFDAPRRQLEVAAADGVLDILRGELEGRQLVGVQPDAHGVFALAEDAHIGHARHRLQPRLDDAVDDVGDLQRGHGLA